MRCPRNCAKNVSSSGPFGSSSTRAARGRYDVVAAVQLFQASSRMPLPVDLVVAKRSTVVSDRPQPGAWHRPGLRVENLRTSRVTSPDDSAATLDHQRLSLARAWMPEQIGVGLAIVIDAAVHGHRQGEPLRGRQRRRRCLRVPGSGYLPSATSIRLIGSRSGPAEDNRSGQRPIGRRRAEGAARLSAQIRALHADRALAVSGRPSGKTLVRTGNSPMLTR